MQVPFVTDIGRVVGNLARRHRSPARAARPQGAQHSIYPCSLVYLDPGAGPSPNNRSRQPLGYVWQAVTLNKSLLRAGMPRLNVFTNSTARVAELLADVPANARPEVHPLLSTRHGLPKSTPFYAAHFKLDLLSQVGSQLPDDSLVLLLDTDMVALRPLDADLIERTARLGVGAFDISDQEFPAYGCSRVIGDLEIVAGCRLRNPRWYGGEFLLATPAFVRRLVARGKEDFERYVSQIQFLNHNGDEAFISAALNALADEGQPILDVGAYQSVGRHWSGNTHRNLAWFKRCAFIHLPGNKPLLEREARQDEFDPARFWRNVSFAHKVGLLRALLKSLLPRMRRFGGRTVADRLRAQAPEEGQEPPSAPKRL